MKTAAQRWFTIAFLLSILLALLPAFSGDAILWLKRTGGSGSGNFPNLPAGFTLLTQNTFTTPGENGWEQYNQVTVGDMSFVQDATAPVSPPGVMQTRFPQGNAAFCAPGGSQKGFAQHSALYWQYAIKFSPNHKFYTHCFNKTLRFHRVGGLGSFDTVVFACPGGDIQYLMMGLGHENVDPFNRFPFNRGEWIIIESAIQANTPGVANGKARLWARRPGQQPVLSISSNSVTWFLKGWTPAWIGVNAFFCAGSPDNPAESYGWHDEVTVFGGTSIE